jgi:hypothetical protein
MKLSSDLQTLRARFYATFPIPTIQDGEAQDVYEQRVREYSTRFGQQAAFALPGQGYGLKRGDRTRPIGKDSLAQQMGATIRSWDLFTGTGTGRPNPSPDPDSEDVSDQYFQVVLPVDYLEGSPVVQPEKPPVLVPPASVDWGPQFTRLEQLVDENDAANERRYVDVCARTEELKAILRQIPRAYVGDVSIRYLGTGQIRLGPAPTDPPA